MGHVHGLSWSERWFRELAAARRCGIDVVVVVAADRRAGRLFALFAESHPQEPRWLVDRRNHKRPGLDRIRRLQIVGRLLSSCARLAPWIHTHPSSGTDADVSARIHRDAAFTHCSSGRHRPVRDRVPAEDQRDQCLRRVHCLVEFLLAAYPYAPGLYGSCSTSCSLCS